MLVDVPEGYGRTGAIKIQKTEQRLKPNSRFWLERVQIEDTGNAFITVALAEAWVYAKQDWRCFFTNQVVLWLHRNGHCMFQQAAALEAIHECLWKQGLIAWFTGVTLQKIERYLIDHRRKLRHKHPCADIAMRQCIADAT